ncbi:MAG: respiratory nitrate reductase subunit gamma, partial [candidate division Zixibacteria bacterium]|nr:respiratory nitrate reductase subunit gamma [Gammaproteobacteria bacterium]NIX59742.1 respiratory nitrate reductase subunit gamma [candidate division Zixibacteria bacterium]
MNALDYVLFIGLPYVALMIFLIGTIQRYRATRFQYSSLSTQFLEGRQLFWGTLPFHWGLLFLFFGHLIAFLIPKSVIVLNSHPLRLLIIEIAAFIFGISALVGLLALFFRRLKNPRLRVVTSKMDVAIEVLLILQVISGLWIALGYRWGSTWFAAVLTPYLYSIFTFQPDIAAVSSLPWIIKSHIAGAFLILLLIPFSRLVHLLVAPLHYLWRPYQRVI